MFDARTVGVFWFIFELVSGCAFAFYLRTSRILENQICVIVDVWWTSQRWTNICGKEEEIVFNGVFLRNAWRNKKKHGGSYFRKHISLHFYHFESKLMVWKLLWAMVTGTKYKNCLNLHLNFSFGLAAEPSIFNTCQCLIFSLFLHWCSLCLHTLTCVASVFIVCSLGKTEAAKVQSNFSSSAVSLTIDLIIQHIFTAKQYIKWDQTNLRHQN